MMSRLKSIGHETWASMTLVIGLTVVGINAACTKSLEAKQTPIPVPNPWERIYTNDSSSWGELTSRMRVQGGWIYSHMASHNYTDHVSIGVGMVFVPDVANVGS